ncbi:MAG: TIGR04282 family arsenosugar biosynthesis glycosyltransferase [Vicinamibacterales bacterium]|nr:TIGR04282 family arsenosugar biosynthesis glycosyltransferase [Vicinamibacterales bacterium]
MVSSARTVVALLTRAPSAGGKTRLFRELDRASDPALLVALLLDTLEAVTASGLPVVVFCEPPEACDDLRRQLPSTVRVEPQAGGDLGERMGAVFDTLMAEGAGRVLVIGSDLPALSPELLRAADAAMAAGKAEVVVGPSLDGGYVLIGACRTPWPLLRGITWSRPDVLARTLEAADRAGLRTVVLPATRDVDTLADLRAVTGGPGAARTRAWTHAHLQ